ncbi:PhzF family phenazine biosynthesis protein [Arthrobacter monumenti]
MREFLFSQVDVFSSEPVKGNPVAVVHGADSLTDEQMAQFARWTNLSETTFLLEPTDPGADYRVRIFTPGGELPFAGHPTLGTCHAWLEKGGEPAREGVVIQECGLGLITLRRDSGKLAFAAPALLRSGAPSEADLRQVVASLGISDDQVLGASWVDNGPGWLGVELDSAQTVLALEPDMSAMGDFKVGVIGKYFDDGPADVEVRAFVPSLGVPEDPVTGSLNAGLAGWLIGEERLPASYVVSQGTALGRRGRVFIDQDDDGVWVGGHALTCVDGQVRI